MILTPEQFGADPTGTVESLKAFGDMIHVAYVMGGATMQGDPAAVYACNSASFYGTADGVTTFFPTPGARCRWTENFQVRARSLPMNSDPLAGPLVNDNSGITLRPYIDFIFDPLAGGIRTLVPLPAVLLADGTVEPNTVKIDEGLNLQFSNAVWDGNGCTQTGNARWIAPGAPTVQGQERPLKGISVGNMKLRAVGEFNCPKAPLLLWCDGAVCPPVDKEGLTGSAIQMSACVNSVITNPRIIGAANGAIGILLFHCIDCAVNDGTVSDLPGVVNVGLYAGQIKGGYGNTVNGVVVTDASGNGTGSDSALLVRGDAPWSSTWILGMYPYATGDWSAPDPQRASQDCFFRNCPVSYSADFAGVKFNSAGLWQESIGGGFDGCTSTRAGVFKYNRLIGGSEANPQGTTVVGTDGVLRGVQLLGQSGNALPGAVIDGFTIDGCAERAIFGSYADSPVIKNGTIASAATATILNNCGDPDIENVTITGCPAGVTIASGQTAVRGAKLRNVSCDSSPPFTITGLCDIREGDVTPYIASKTTTSIATTLIQSTVIPEGWAGTVTATVIGDVGGVVNRFRQSADVSCSAGVITVGAATVLENTNPSTLGGLSFTTSTTLRTNVKGKTGFTVAWTLVELVFT